MGKDSKKKYENLLSIKMGIGFLNYAKRFNFGIIEFGIIERAA